MLLNNEVPRRGGGPAGRNHSIGDRANFWCGSML